MVAQAPPDNVQYLAPVPAPRRADSTVRRNMGAECLFEIARNDLRVFGRQDETQKRFRDPRRFGLHHPFTVRSFDATPLAIRRRDS